MADNFSITTPEEITIYFELIKGAACQELKQSGLEIPEGFPAIDLLRRPAYMLTDGKVFHYINPGMQRGILYNNFEDYEKANRTSVYYETSIIIDMDDSAMHYCFYLENAKSYYDQPLKKLDQYPEFEGYRAYLLPNNRICFLRKLTTARYQGTWYADEENFKFYYWLGTSYAQPPRGFKRRRYNVDARGIK